MTRTKDGIASIQISCVPFFYRRSFFLSENVFNASTMPTTMFNFLQLSWNFRSQFTLRSLTKDKLFKIREDSPLKKAFQWWNVNKKMSVTRHEIWYFKWRWRFYIFFFSMELVNVFGKIVMKYFIGLPRMMKQNTKRRS